jgi:hypothetical protein
MRQLIEVGRNAERQADGTTAIGDSGFQR